LANNRIQVKRTNVAGRTANVTNSGNLQYIAAGELAINMADGILYSSNGSALIEIGSNNTNVRVTSNLTVNAIVANGSLGTAGQVLHSNGTATYWAADDNAGGTVTSVSGTGTVSGLTLSGTVTTTGSLTLGGTLSASVIDNMTDEHRLFNNMGDAHSTRTSFDATTPSYNFGWRYVQGNTNGPNLNSATQYYSEYIGLGNDYPATGAGSYGMQIAIPRNVSTPYIGIRFNEANVLGAWQKISAGFADTANNSTYFGGYTWAAPAILGGTTANGASLTYANVSGQVNTATLYAATSANIASAVQANATGVYTTGTVNAASFTVGSSVTANSTTTKTPVLLIDRSASAARGINWYSTGYTAWQEYMASAGTSQGWTGTVTAPSGTYVTSWALRSFIENSSGYGWTWEGGTNTSTAPSIVAELSSATGNFRTIGAIYSGSTLIGNTTGPYGKTEGSLNVNSAVTVTTNTSTNTFTIGTGTYFVSNGNVGIGVATPAYKLESNGDISTNFAGASKFIWNRSGVYFNWVECDGVAGNNYMRFALGNAEQVRFQSNGNVGIGNTAPAHRLRVEGTTSVLGNVAVGSADTATYNLFVNGSFAATTKSFVIDHPTKKGMKLRHGSLEGPENGVYVRGRTNTNIIELPDYWTKLIDKDSITVSLTAIGKTISPSVGKVTNKKITLIGDNIDCYFHVFAERKDVEKIVVEY
jgi:hypothetical protein